MPAHAQDRHWPDAAVAVLLAGLLSCAWTLRDWANLSALRLPDTDDVVRLQQIRDWIGGQAFGDLAQHRLGPVPGLEMHWSRLPDLVPGALIRMLAPLVGTHASELSAVILWPALLFAVALFLVANVARALGTSGPLAAVIAALAYPATTLFVPGRIDHHGLQMVLLLVVVRAVIGRPSLGWGLAAGMASVASIAIGLETAPLLAVGGATIVAMWARRGREEQPRLAGYSAALALPLAVGAVLLRTNGWAYPACDGFTGETWRGAQFAAVVLLGLAAFGFGFPGRAGRLIGCAVAGIVAIGGVLLFAPDCLHPYGGVDPLLARIWLANVAEAQPLFGAPVANAIGYMGLMAAGIGASLLALSKGVRAQAWVTVLALQLTAVAITFAQLRGAYAGALLAAPALAALIASARLKGPLFLIPAWLVSAGLLYPLLGNALTPAAAGTGTTAADCTGPHALDQLETLPPGTLMAPIDLGAFALAATPHRVIAAPYHRNGAGNGAMFRFFLGSPDRSETIARTLGVSYVAFCPGGFRAGAGSLAHQLDTGRVPAWLEPIATPSGSLKLYRFK